MVGRELQDIKIAFIYCGGDHDLAALTAAVTAALPGAPLIGCTACQGLILPCGFVGGEKFVGLLALEDLHLAGLAPVIGRVPFAGVSAADSRLGTNWALLTEEGPLHDGLALAFFYGGRRPVTSYASLCRPVGSYGTVTKMIGRRRLVEIDGRPALRVIAEKNRYPLELMRGGDLSLATPLTPLGVMDSSGEIIARLPQYGNADGSLYVGGPLFEGQNLLYLEGSVEDIVSGCGRELAGLRRRLPGRAGAFQLALNYTWKIAADDRFDEMVGNLVAAAGETPFICALTNGEPGFISDGGNACGGPMISCTGFWD